LGIIYGILFLFLSDKVLKMTDVVGMIDARETPALRGSYKKKTAEISN
jgi:hypothetical protein